jgi:YesN/AraC family two-component response regulator
MDEIIKYCPPHENHEKSFYYDHVHIKWNEQITIHQSDSWELSYILKGSGTRVLGNTVEIFTTGEVIFIPPNIPHGWYFDEFDHDEEGKIENITIIFDLKLLDQFAVGFPETASFIGKLKEYSQALKFEGKTLKSIQKIMTQMVRQNDMEQLASLLILFTEIADAEELRVVSNFKKQNKGAEKMQEVSRFMVHNSHRKISLDEVAQYVGMNRSSFCTFYKREKGKSFFSALNEYRIDCSCVMLRETTKPIADICFAVGFDDIPYYNRTFKKLKGQSPKDYRGRTQIQHQSD